MQLNQKIDTVKIADIPYYVDDRGDLAVMDEEGVVPFNISRVFTVRALKGAVRGKHAHKKCSQFMVCISGSVEVLCDDGCDKKKYLLDAPSVGLNVPPGIWAEEVYLEDNSVLTVLCDRSYEESDYIRDYDEFKKFNEI